METLLLFQVLHVSHDNFQKYIGLGQLHRHALDLAAHEIILDVDAIYVTSHQDWLQFRFCGSSLMVEKAEENRLFLALQAAAAKAASKKAWLKQKGMKGMFFTARCDDCKAFPNPQYPDKDPKTFATKTQHFMTSMDK